MISFLKYKYFGNCNVTIRILTKKTILYNAPLPWINCQLQFRYNFISKLLMCLQPLHFLPWLQNSLKPSHFTALIVNLYTLGEQVPLPTVISITRWKDDLYHFANFFKHSSDKLHIETTEPHFAPRFFKIQTRAGTGTNL